MKISQKESTTTQLKYTHTNSNAHLLLSLKQQHNPAGMKKTRKKLKRLEDFNIAKY